MSVCDLLLLELKVFPKVMPFVTKKAAIGHLTFYGRRTID